MSRLHSSMECFTKFEIKCLVKILFLKRQHTGLSDQNVKTCRNQVSTFFIYIRFLLLQALLINENLILERTVPSVFV